MKKALGNGGIQRIRTLTADKNGLAAEDGFMDKL
jgi:hypothetical protein